ncbi:MAG: type III pantothenate kinase [Eubacterium sp.]|nr:type III pantothenate kinase [Eubacterium sp.]
MLLTLDVGNTNITIGVFDGEKLLCTLRITTKLPRTSDEYGTLLKNLMRDNDIDPADIQAAIISSVVPAVMYSLRNGLYKYLHVDPLIIEPGVKTGIHVVTENPSQIGADRIVDAVGAYTKYGGPVLVLDFGTATTYDLVDEKGQFLSGITAPGIRTAARALWQEAAKLPEIEIKKPKSILARETISSMQAGLVYGQIGQTEYIIEKVREESGYKDLKVVATGGLGAMIAAETRKIDIYDPNLTLDGMRIIYEKNK